MVEELLVFKDTVNCPSRKPKRSLGLGISAVSITVRLSYHVFYKLTKLYVKRRTKGTA